MRLELGRKGEDIAVNFLKKRGYDIKERNYRSSLGEIDIIAEDKKGVLHFIEVKARKDKSMDGLFSINKTKIERMYRLASCWLKKVGLSEDKKDIKFDIISIINIKDKNVIRDKNINNKNHEEVINLVELC